MSDTYASSICNQHCHMILTLVGFFFEWSVLFVPRAIWLFRQRLLCNSVAAVFSAVKRRSRRLVFLEAACGCCYHIGTSRRKSGRNDSVFSLLGGICSLSPSFSYPAKDPTFLQKTKNLFIFLHVQGHWRKFWHGATTLMCICHLFTFLPGY